MLNKLLSIFLKRQDETKSSDRVSVITPTLSRTVMIADEKEVIGFLIEEIERRDEILNRLEKEKLSKQKL